MFLPPLANRRELTLKPRAGNLNDDAALGVMVNAGDHLEFLGALQDSLREGHGLVRVRGAVRCRETHLRQHMFKAYPLRYLGVAEVRIRAPARALGGLQMARPPGTLGI